MTTSLDDRLRRWHRRQGVTDVHLARLAQAIAGELRRQAPVPARSPAPAPAVGIGIKLAYAMAGAVLMAGALTFWPRGPSPAVRATSAAALAQIDGAQLAALSRVFANMQELFADQLRWVTETERQVDFGVAAQPEDGRPVARVADPPVCMRLTVVARRTATAAWAPVWYQDVVLRCEDRIEVQAGANAGGRLGLWVFRLDDGRLAVESDFDLAAPIPLRARLDTVLEAGLPAQVLSMRDGSTEYRVYQTVQPLPAALPTVAGGGHSS